MMEIIYYRFIIDQNKYYFIINQSTKYSYSFDTKIN